MKTKIVLSLALIAAICQCLAAQTEPRRFYKYDVIETTNSGIDVFSAPSINDYGDVAYSARRTPGGGTVFLSAIGQPNVDLMPGAGSTQFVGGRVQINNSRQVIQQTFISQSNRSG